MNDLNKLYEKMTSVNKYGWALQFIRLALMGGQVDESLRMRALEEALSDKWQGLLPDEREFLEYVISNYPDLVKEAKTRAEQEGYEIPNPWNVLLYYADSPFTYMHFTNTKELIGINPRTTFSTPAGIYGYPLTSKMVNEIKERGTFGTDRKNIVIFSAKNPDTMLNIDVYSESDLLRDVKTLYLKDMLKIKKRRGNIPTDPARVVPYINSLLNNSKFDKDHQPYLILANILERISNFDLDIYYELFRVVGSPNPEYYNEETLNKDIKTLIKYMEAYDQINTPYDKLLNESKTNARNPGDPGSRLFYILNETASGNAAIFNKLLRTLGYSGANDSGKGVIHNNEPAQGFVLGRGDADILDIIDNPFSDYEGKFEETEIPAARPYKADIESMRDVEESRESVYIAAMKLPAKDLLAFVNTDDAVLHRILAKRMDVDDLHFLIDRVKDEVSIEILASRIDTEHDADKLLLKSGSKKDRLVINLLNNNSLPLNYRDEIAGKYISIIKYNAVKLPNRYKTIYAHILPHNAIFEIVQSGDYDPKMLERVNDNILGRVFKYTSSLIPPEIFDRLYNINERPIKNILGGNILTPEHILEKLAEDPSYHSILSKNRGSNSRVLDKIVDGLSTEPLDSKTKHATAYIINSIVNNPNSSPEVLEKLYNKFKGNNEYSYVVQDVASRRDLTDEVSRKLVKEPFLWSHLAGNHNVPPDVLDYIAKNTKHTYDRTLIAKNRRTSVETLDFLVDSGNIDTITDVLSNPNAPAHILDKIKDKLSPNENISDFVFLARHKNAPPEMLEELSEHPSEAVSRAVAANPKTPHKTLLSFLSEIRPIRERVAENPAAGDDILKKLIDSADKHDYTLCDAIAKNDKASSEVLDALYNKFGSYSHFLPANHNCSEELLTKIYVDPETDYSVRGLIAANPNTPKHILNEMAADKDTDSDCLRAVAENPNTPLTAFRHLLKNKDNKILTSIIDNRAAPQEIKNQAIVCMIKNDYFSTVRDYETVKFGIKYAEENLDKEKAVRFKRIQLGSGNIRIIRDLSHDPNLSIKLEALRQIKNDSMLMRSLNKTASAQNIETITLSKNDPKLLEYKDLIFEIIKQRYAKELGMFKWMQALKFLPPEFISKLKFDKLTLTINTDTNKVMAVSGINERDLLNRIRMFAMSEGLNVKDSLGALKQHIENIFKNKSYAELTVDLFERLYKVVRLIKKMDSEFNDDIYIYPAYIASLVLPYRKMLVDENGITYEKKVHRAETVGHKVFISNAPELFGVAGAKTFEEVLPNTKYNGKLISSDGHNIKEFEFDKSLWGK